MAAILNYFPTKKWTKIMETFLFNPLGSIYVKKKIQLFYIYMNKSFFTKIIVAIVSAYINTYKTTPSSSFYTVYYQIYSDYKNFGERWRPSWIFPRKIWKQFFQSFTVTVSEKSQLSKIYMKMSQNDTMTYTNVFYIYTTCTQELVCYTRY